VRKNAATSTKSAGFKRQPPLLLKGGDVVEIEIEKIGRLNNSVHDGNMARIGEFRPNRIDVEEGIK
jgi:fumarylacetoacetate (FAA) hydrolase family protein